MQPTDSARAINIPVGRAVSRARRETQLATTYTQGPTPFFFTTAEPCSHDNANVLTVVLIPCTFTIDGTGQLSRTE